MLIVLYIHTLKGRVRSKLLNEPLRKSRSTPQSRSEGSTRAFEVCSSFHREGFLRAI